MEKIISVVPRMTVSYKSPCIEIQMNTRKTFAGDLKTAIREVCKRHVNYSIKVDNGGINGRSNNGETIPIDTLGKWLFGTPGYMGHIMMSPHDPKVLVVYYPVGAPSEAIQMLQSLTAENIQAACRHWGDERYS